MLTNFPFGVSSFGIPVYNLLGIGNVYFVKNKADSDYAKFISERQTTYVDGSQAVYTHDATSTVVTTNGLKAAFDACVDSRNDYVIVVPSTTTFYTDVLLKMTKKCVHFLCPAALTNMVGCTNAVRIQQIGSAVSILSVENGGIEIAGFYLKNIDAYAHIQVPTTATCVADGGASAWGISIHHNYFVSRSTTTTLPMLYCTGDGASYSRIENNWFTEQVSSGAWTTGIVAVAGNACSTDICNNYFSVGDSCTATYGIANLSVKSMCAYNTFSECGGSGAGVTGGTITHCLYLGATVAAVGNLCATATGHFATGGTAGVSYANNIDGTATSGTDHWNLPAA